MILAQDEYLTIAEAGKALGVSRPTVYRWLKSGKLVGVRVARQLIPRSEIDKLLFPREVWTVKMLDAVKRNIVMKEEPELFNIGFIRPVTGCVLGKKKKEEKDGSHKEP